MSIRERRLTLEERLKKLKPPRSQGELNEFSTTPIVNHHINPDGPNADFLQEQMLLERFIAILTHPDTVEEIRVDVLNNEEYCRLCTKYGVQTEELDY